MLFGHLDFAGVRHVRQARCRVAVDKKNIGRETDGVTRHRQHRSQAES